MIEKQTRTAAALFGLLAAVAVGAPAALAQSSGNDSPSASAATHKPAADKPVQDAEKRISELRSKLQITTAQQPQWDAYVQVQRDNAQEMSRLIDQRSQNLQSMNAVDDFRSYEEIAEAHATGLKKAVTAFQALYDTLSDSQKKTADTLFANHIQNHENHEKRS